MVRNLPLLTPPTVHRPRLVAHPSATVHRVDICSPYGAEVPVLAVTLAVLFASASALTTAASTALQHHAASTVVLGDTGLLRRLARRPVWLAALALGPLGFTWHALALQHGPISLVQPIVIVGIVAALPLSTALAGSRTTPAGLRAALATVAALALFLLVTSPSDAPGGGADPTRLAPATAATLLAALGCLAASVRRRGARAGWLGSASGLLFGLMAVLVEVVVGAVADAASPAGGVMAVAASWPPYVLCVAGCGGLVVNQFAYRAAGLAASMPLLNVVNCVVTLAFGVLVLGERWSTSPFSLAIGAVALAVVLRGLWVLGRSAGARSGPDGPGARSGSADVAVADHDVLGGGHLGQAHRAAGVQLLGADPDLGAEPELSPVGEPR